MKKIIKIYIEDVSEFDGEPTYTEYIYELKRSRDISKEEYEYQILIQKKELDKKINV